jgi:hypothetical protein
VLYTAASFVAFFREQQYVELLVIGAVAALVYGAVVVVPVAAVVHSAWGHGAIRLVLVSVPTILFFALGVVVYEAVAHYHRFVPPGSGAERLGEAEERWIDLARLGFAGLYLLALGVAGSLGYALGRRRLAVAAVLVTVGFMALTWWFVNGISVCDVGFGFGDYGC